MKSEMELEMKLEEQLLKICREKNITVSLAESCTGGAISARITAIAGASLYFKGSIVCYSNFAKKKLLGVSEEVLNTDGPVSSITVQLLQKSVLQLLESDFSLAITGVAGPSGGTDQTPVGTVFIAVGGTDGETTIYKEFFKGNREDIISQASDRALEILNTAITLE